MRFARLDPKNFPPGTNPGSDLLDPSKRLATWEDIHDAINYLIKMMDQNHYRPTKIVGVSRGGSIPAVLLSHKLGVLDVDYLRISSYSPDSEPGEAGRLRIDLPFDVESMLQMKVNPMEVLGHHAKLLDKPSTLIVDDIWDSGQTMKWIRDSYPQALTACLYWKGQQGPHMSEPLPPVNFPGTKVSRWVKDPSKSDRHYDTSLVEMKDVWYNMPWEPTPKDWRL